MRRVFLVLLVLLLASHAGGAWAWRGEVGWTFKADAGLSSGVAVTGDLVIVGDDAGTLYAVRRSSGQLAWSYNGTNTIVGTPSILGDRTIFAQADGTVMCLSLSGGDVVWQYRPPEESYAAETLADGTAVGDGKVFLVKGDGRLYALDASDGRPLWTYGSGQELRSAPGFGAGLVLLGEQKGIFSAIDPKTGKRLWGGGAGGPIHTPVIAGDSVLFSSWDGTVQCVRIKGVIPQWKADVQDPVATPPGVGGGKAFVGTARGNVAAIDLKSGAVLWQFNTQGGSLSARPVFGEGMVFAGGGQGVLSILDAQTGKLISTFTTGQGIDGTPAFDGGVLYLGSSDGNLYAII